MWPCRPAAVQGQLQAFDVPANVTQFIPQGAALVALVLVGLRAKSRGSFARLWRRSSRIPLGRTRKPALPPRPAPQTDTHQELKEIP